MNDVAIAQRQAQAPTLDEMVRRAEALLPALRERAYETEKNRRLPDETVREFRAAGFPKIMQPARFGGYQLGADAAAEVVRTLSSGCASSGWVANLMINHNWMVSLFPMEAQEEYWDGATDRLISTGSMSTRSQLEVVDGGYRLSGRWKFSSGCDFADWFIIMKPSATSFDWMLIPRSDVTIEDDWFTSGLCGTGSRDIILDNVFVPSHRSVAAVDVQGGTTPGGTAHGIPIMRMPFGLAATWSIPPVLLGAAAGMAEAVRQSLIGKKALFTGEAQVERVANQVRLTEALTDIHAAELVMRHRMAEIMKWAEAGGPPSQLEALSSGRDAAYVARVALRVADSLSLMAGASAIYLTNPVQRFLRDIHAGATHVSIVWEEHAERYGRALWDLPPKVPGK
jgi:3-hydroxy-9,10-secoandrosta-1,3,5(10)-triene-9,17-dione monooxygenase